MAAAGIMTKFAVALVFFVVIGLQLTSAKLSRPMQKSKSEAIEYHESEGDDKKLYLSSIDEKDVSTLIDGIKKKNHTGRSFIQCRETIRRTLLRSERERPIV